MLKPLLCSVSIALSFAFAASGVTTAMPVHKAPLAMAREPLLQRAPEADYGLEQAQSNDQTYEISVFAPDDTGAIVEI